MRTRSVAAVAALVLLTSGCTSAPAQLDGTVVPSPSASAQDVSVDLSYGPATIGITIHPIQRIQDRLVLTLGFEAGADDADEFTYNRSPLAAAEQLWTSDWSDAREFDGVRLVDLSEDRVASTGMGADGRTLHASTTWTSGDIGRAEELQLVFGDLGGDDVDLYLPKIGLVEDIPVQDGDAPALASATPIDPSQAQTLPVSAMESYAYDLASETRTAEGDDGTTLSLSSDVLFATASADLSAAADETIRATASEIVAHEPGEVTVVGHTDDRDTDAYNQDLSERRAQAVADRLSQLIDTQAYPLVISGRGESEPIADNGTAEGRAVNRRVDLGIATPLDDDAETTASTAIPAFSGAQAPGATGITTDEGGTPVRISSPGARIVDGHLIVTVQLERLDDAVDSAIGIGSLGVNGLGMPDYFSTVKTAGGIAVLSGSLATFPAFHRVGEDSIAVPLADIRTNARIDGGQTRTFDLVYPRGLVVADTVTIQLMKDKWRLTDIPVTTQDGD